MNEITQARGGSLNVSIQTGQTGLAGTHQRSSVAVFLCFLVAILEGFDLQVAGVAGPRMAPALGLDAATLGWFFSASTIGLFFGAIAGGRLSDLFGRRRVLAGSVASFGLFCVITGLVTDPATLIAARVLTGVGLGGALPNLLALTAEHAAAGHQKRALALLYCGVPVGGGAVSLLSSLWNEDWRLLFYVGGLLPVLLTPFLFRFLPSDSELERRSWADAADRVSTLEFLKEGRAVASVLLWIAFFTTLVILYLVLSWLPSLIVGVGLQARQASLVQVAFNVGGILACAATASLLDGARPWRVAAVAYVAIAFVLYAASMISSFPQALTIGLSLGAAVLVTQSFLYAQAPLLYPPSSRGIGIGAAVAAGRLGSIAGPMMGAVLVGAGGGSGSVLKGIIPVALVAGVSAVALSLLAGKHERRAR